MPSPLRILVIIPCYNEEEALPALLEELKINSRYSITSLVINDCSTDNTAAVARAAGTALIDLPVNLGIGGAMQTGFLYARNNGFDLAIQMDGDGQHLPSELAKLIDRYKESGTNVIIGSRFLSEHSFRSTRARRTGIYFFHLLSKLLIHRNIYDCTSGFRLLDKQAISIAARDYPDEYPEPESLVLFAKCGLAVEEIPVIMRERQGGASSIRSFAALYYMVKVSMAMIFSYIRYSKKQLWYVFK